MIGTDAHESGGGVRQAHPGRSGGVAAAVKARRPARVMPVREYALRGMCGEIGSQPAFLRRTHTTPADLAAVGVERDQMPRPDVEGVIASPAF